ncbi:dihydrolipoamide acetyltransferase family protein [Spirulina subsalsa]|uniref:dihydrolipoamide acetyltransferase family protein n=1 Tax=Spirulina subsalsa TaxID=54311 RepID=UPI0002FF5F16|nr:dihydrolipoamide acetyltransferase family protein [Spirulina subsalsa]
MIHDIFMPALSSTMTEGKIVSWVKSPGDKVEKGETVVVVESDKADMDVESFYEGYLAVVLVDAGQEAPVGAPIALLAETEAEIETAKQQAPSQSRPAAPQSAPAPVAPEPGIVAVTTASVDTTSTDTGSRNGGRIVASPRARKLAKTLKVKLSTIQGSGPHGRIVAADVEAAAGKVPTPTVAKPLAISDDSDFVMVSPPALSPTNTPGEVKAMSTLQKAVVRNMVASLTVPEFRVGYTITTDALDQLYQQIKSKGVTMTAMLAKAIAVTLQKHPIVNASYVQDGIHYASRINIAIAVAIGNGGLITPVLKNVDQMDLYSLSRTWKDLVNRARSKKLQPDEYNSGTFTISNLGMYGVDQFDAILPPGQGAIIAIGASRPQVVATEEGLMGVKRQMQVNLTCDHRIISGAEAAAFLQDLAQLLETNPQSLTL